jgi:hypothetical protein
MIKLLDKTKGTIPILQQSIIDAAERASNGHHEMNAKSYICMK